jgi:non-ribosomal peptide synthetase component F
MSRAPAALPIDHGGPVDRPFEAFPESALDGSIIDRFEAVARRFPERLAVQDLARRLSYAELATQADRIAAATTAAVADRPGTVAILLRSDAFYPAAILGALDAARATPDDKVASLGGDSLQAVEIAAELEREFGIAIPTASWRQLAPFRTLRRGLRNSSSRSPGRD